MRIGCSHRCRGRKCGRERQFLVQCNWQPTAAADHNVEPRCSENECGADSRHGRDAAQAFAGSDANAKDFGRWVGRALHSTGAVRTVQRADLMGTSWREQDAPISCRQCDNIIHQLKVVHLFVILSPLVTTICGSRSFGMFMPRVPIFAAARLLSSGRRRSVDIPAPWRRRRAIATDRTDAPSPVPGCRRRDRSGVRDFC